MGARPTRRELIYCIVPNALAAKQFERVYAACRTGIFESFHFSGCGPRSPALFVELWG